MLPKQGELLEKVNSPDDLKKLSGEQLPRFCEELRQFIIDVVSENGGHFAANLGVVELTTALHYVYQTPYDRLIWDVGHQAYGHKIITGRKNTFDSNRTLGGISGFPKRSESEFDAFGVGHSSTSVSAVLGMTLASKIKGETGRHHIAVIGDGALTAGLAYEGLNHAGYEKDTDILVVLNDNRMAIDPSTGAIHNYLNKLTSTEKTEEACNWFEDLGFQYFGPVDGHDVNLLVNKLEELKALPGPKLLHCLTIKGKGYAPAEANQTRWHATGEFDKITGKAKKEESSLYLSPKFQDVFGQTLLELAQENPKIVGITPAMPTGSSLDLMMKAIPNRAFDVGIAEPHAVTLSAGLASEGMIVFCNIYSTFMQRAYDQVIHDVCIQNLPVIFCLDRAGLVGEDGGTHHGIYDIAYMRTIPNMVVASPLNERDLRDLMFLAQSDEFQKMGKAITIRYPRGRGVEIDWKKPFKKIKTGKGQKLRDGEQVAVISLGPVGNDVAEAIRECGWNVAHYDLRFVKPLDEDLLNEVFQKFESVITVEDGALMGGMGSAILEFMNVHGYYSAVKCLGIPDVVVEHGTQKQLKMACGIDKEGIIQAIQSFKNKLTT